MKDRRVWMHSLHLLQKKSQTRERREVVKEEELIYFANV